jgi:hypothetical protein
MKALGAVALTVAGLAIPLCAQRSATHGGVSGHAAPPSHGGFSTSAPRANSGFHMSRPAGPARFAGTRPLTIAHGSQPRSGGTSTDRRDDPERRRHRRPYVSPFGGLYTPGYGAFGWINPYPLGYPDSSDTDPSAVSSNQGGAAGYDSQPDALNPMGPGIPYPPSADYSQPQPSPQNEQAVTIIFKDGRQPEQIHNYILTRSTLIIGDSQRREIPTEQLDLAATAKVNQDAGVDFSLPSTAR